MVKFSGKIVLLVALALIVSAVQCAAACTPVTCGDPQPPCHHHKQAPADQNTGCTHELLPATIVQTSVLSVGLVAEAVDALPVPGALVSFDTPPVHDPSPPGLHARLLIVLRV